MGELREPENIMYSIKELKEKFNNKKVLITGHTGFKGSYLCVLFGLPFALLQRKRDITTAMISHGIVDAVRFTLLGI